MAIGIENYTNVTAGDSDYPNGRSKDNTGSLNGTPVNVTTLSDYQQYFAKLLRIANITANGLPDNEYSGLQYYEALLAIAGNKREIVCVNGPAASNVVEGNFNTEVTVLRDADPGQVVSLSPSTLPYIGKIKIANYSFASVSVQVTGIETINGGAAPFTLPSRSVIEFQYDNVSNWSIILRYLIP